ncbi:MAG TPA: hypothetical protein VGP80_05830 [Gemmatimonadales bacterium]|nr:hypothetical protein [Gemmatimonadales bacterium]
MRFCVLVLGISLWSLPVAAQGGRWSTRDRVVIGDFTRITSIAAAQDRVYATSPTSLVIWNPQFRQWDAPITPDDPTLLERVFTALIDPLDNSLWLGRVDGWVHFQPSIQLWDRGLVATGVQEIAFDMDQPIAGLFVRSGGNWLLVPRGGTIAMPTQPPAHPIKPATIQDAIAANPGLQAFGAQILMDNQLAVARYTAAARSVDGLGWYLGTWGVGPLYLQDGAGLPQRLTFGLPGQVAGALYMAPGGVWVSTDQTTSQRAGLAFVASDLSDFSWIQGKSGFGLPFGYVRRIVGLEQNLWAATDAGVARINPESGQVDLIDQGRGLVDNRVFTVATRRGLLAAGTAHGLALISDAGAVERVAPDYADAAFAIAFSAQADTLWVGTPRGLRAAVRGQNDLSLPTELETAAALGEPVIALAWSGDTLMGITEDRLIWRDNRLKSWWLGPTLSASLGRLRGFAAAPGGVWIAGEQAVGFVPFNAMPVRMLRFPADLPGRPFDVVVDDDYLWISTDLGLVRFRLDAVRP